MFYGAIQSKTAITRTITYFHRHSLGGACTRHVRWHGSARVL